MQFTLTLNPQTEADWLTIVQVYISMLSLKNIGQETSLGNTLKDELETILKQKYGEEFEQMKSSFLAHADKAAAIANNNKTAFELN